MNQIRNFSLLLLVIMNMRRGTSAAPPTLPLIQVGHLSVYGELIVLFLKAVTGCLPRNSVAKIIANCSQYDMKWV